MNEFNDMLTFIGPYLGIATQVVGVFAIIARFTPTPIDNVVAVAAKQIINWLAMNSGEAENVAIPGDKTSVEERKKRVVLRQKKAGPRH